MYNSPILNVDNLNKMILFWRKKRDKFKTEKDKYMARCYIDAFQTVRINNGLKPLPESPDILMVCASKVLSVEEDMTNEDMLKLKSEGYTIEAVNDKLVVGFCEYCNALIYDDDDEYGYSRDDSAYICGKCMEKASEQDNPDEND